MYGVSGFLTLTIADQAAANYLNPIETKEQVDPARQMAF